MILAVVEESQFYIKYVAKGLIYYYLDLVDTGTESVGQRQEDGVHVDSLLELVVRSEVAKTFCADKWGNKQKETKQLKSLNLVSFRVSPAPNIFIKLEWYSKESIASSISA
jgi:hypothetical protein